MGKTKELQCCFPDCNVIVTVSHYSRSALCDPHRRERYPNKYKEVEVPVEMVFEDPIIDDLAQSIMVVEDQFDEAFPGLTIPSLDDFPELKRIRRITEHGISQ